MTAPSVVYKVEMNDGEVVDVDAPAKMADADRRQSVSEPYVDMEVFCPKEYGTRLGPGASPHICAPWQNCLRWAAHGPRLLLTPLLHPSTTGTRGR